MENSEGIPIDFSVNKPKETTVKLDEKYRNLFGIETAIVYNKDIKPDTIRVYRGIHDFNNSSLDNQTSNMMRYLDENRNMKTNPEIAEVVEVLATNPTPENYQKVVDESKRLGLNNFIIEKPNPNLILQHTSAISNDIGSSPWVASTSDPFEALNNTGVNFGAILIIDIPKDRITLDEHTDENEVLINGYVKKEEISAVLLVDKTKIDSAVPIFGPQIDQEKSIELVNLAKTLTQN